MRAGIFFTGTGPILLLTSYGDLNDSTLVEKPARKGSRKPLPVKFPKTRERRNTANILTQSWAI